MYRDLNFGYRLPPFFPSLQNFSVIHHLHCETSGIMIAFGKDEKKNIRIHSRKKWWTLSSFQRMHFGVGFSPNFFHVRFCFFFYEKLIFLGTLLRPYPPGPSHAARFWTPSSFRRMHFCVGFSPVLHYFFRFRFFSDFLREKYKLKNCFNFVVSATRWF